MLASPEVDEVNRKLSLATCTTIVGLAGTPACRWVSAKHDGRPSRTKIHWEQFNEQPKIYLSYCRLYGCYPGSRGARRAPEPLDSGAGDQRPNNWPRNFAKTCDQARSALDQLQAPVIFCDRDLKGGEWRDVVQVLASSPHRACVILTSRVVDDYLWNEVVQRGGYDVLPKPLREEDVVRAVRLAWSYWNTARRTSVFPASDRDAGRIRK